MCYCPLAGELTKIYHPTTINAGLSYLYTACTALLQWTGDTGHCTYRKYGQKLVKSLQP